MRFKPSLRDTMRASVAAQRLMALGAPDEKREAAMEFLAQASASIPPAPKPRGPRHRPDIDAMHRIPDQAKESEVIAAISELLSRHPRVLLALRMNSGMASYDAGSGRYAPVWFHKFLRYPARMKMPDFIGFLTDRRPFAIEAKRPSWSKPVNEREELQAAFLGMVCGLGGIGIFATSAEQVAVALERS